MGRFRQRMQDRYQSEINNPDARYDLAYRRVKRIKGFYIHVFIYLFVNAFIIIGSSNQDFITDGNFWQWQNFNTVFFWGIGLLAHGLSVFGRDIFFGRNWEENKIREFMDKDNRGKWE